MVLNPLQLYGVPHQEQSGLGSLFIAVLAFESLPRKWRQKGGLKKWRYEAVEPTAEGKVPRGIVKIMSIPASSAGFERNAGRFTLQWRDSGQWYAAQALALGLRCGDDNWFPVCLGGKSAHFVSLEGVEVGDHRRLNSQPLKTKLLAIKMAGSSLHSQIRISLSR